MADLKAAAKRYRESAEQSQKALRIWEAALNKYYRDRLEASASDATIAAQALEAWAWQQKMEAKVKPCWTGERWFCQVADGEYVADTPLGCVLAAMEGEKDGND